MMHIKTNLKTEDGLTIYDLSPKAGDLIACAGPDGADPADIEAVVDWDGNWDLPAGFRWVSDDEWAAACARAE